MIEDAFNTTQTSPTNALAECKRCGECFDVVIDIVFPKNCEYDNLKALTVICPRCGVRATSTEEESKIKALRAEIKARDDFMQDYHQKHRLRFNGLRVDPEELVAWLECGMCGIEFDADFKKGKNVQFRKDKVAIVCPLCENTDETTRDVNRLRLKALMAMAQLPKFQRQLDAILNPPKTEPEDGAQGG